VHVLALCDYYDDVSAGGAEVVAREVYTRLALDHGVQITVVGALPRAQWRQSFDRPDGNPRCVRVAGTDLTGLLGAQMMIGPKLMPAARLAALADPPDLVHVNGLHFHSAVVGLRLARRLRLPLVSTAHLADVAAMPGPARLAATVFDRVWAGGVARRSDRVVAVSDAVGRHLALLGVDPGRIAVAYNGVDQSRFRPRPGPFRSTDLRVAIVGRLTANKGPLLALDAVAAARSTGRDVRLVVVGDGPLAARARHRANEADLAGAVQFTGRVADVERWLAEADVALRPSYTEGLPLGVIEALACGTPVICTDVPGTLEVVRDGINGIVVPIGDVQRMGAALVKLHDDRAALERMSRAATDTASVFSWSVSAAVHRSAFEAAIGSPPGQPVMESSNAC
jgi:glycosyltransferase involved in cell wall biosynthesis